MNYRIVFTDTAREDLRALAFQLAELTKDRETAKRFAAGVREIVKQLERFPFSGALPRDRVLKSAGYRYLAYQEYLIFYQTDEKNAVVNILAVFHAKRDYLRVMRRFL